MASVKEALYEASKLFDKGFRNVVIAMESAGNFLYVDYNPAGFATETAIATIQRSGSYTLAAVFGWGHDKNRVPVLRFRAVPGFRTAESQESIVWEFRRQQCVQQVLKEEQEKDAANYQ
jgi:hypothetical protein